MAAAELASASSSRLVRVLFFMGHPGAVRNFEAAIRLLAKHGHEVHLAFEHPSKTNLPGADALADSVVRDHPGVTSAPHPSLRDREWVVVAAGLRSALDALRYRSPEFEKAPRLRERASGWAPPGARRVIATVPLRCVPVLRATLELAERSAPRTPDIEAYVRAQRPDVVVITPFVDPGSVQVEYVRAAKALGVPTLVSVASWDNLTVKGLFHEQPDVVTVWNALQCVEVTEMHRIAMESVVVTGAVAYDHWLDWRPDRTRERFAHEARIDPARPFVLYVGSSPFIAPNEAAFFGRWLRGIRRSGLDAQVVVRAHPQNPLTAPFASGGGAPFDGVVAFPAAPSNPIELQSRNDYFDTIYHSAAVVGVNTSAFLEAAIVGRSVHTILDDANAGAQEGTLHFQHLLKAGGGLVHVARDYQAHVAQLRHAIMTGGEARRAFVAEFLRPHGADEPAAPRLVGAIEALAGRGRRQPQPRARVLTRVGGRTLALGARAAARRMSR